ncbi:MAG: M4 family metallopeptidase [Clostridiales bacterium]|jgi:Zn-dependent metalloprotease|nr:M4 family metallopeptidase [Clostridiales bacterium]
MKLTKKLASLFIALALVIGSAVSAMAATSYADVPSSHWANSVISKWSGDGYGVLVGDGSGSFLPEKGITLGELATILTKTFGYVERVATVTTPSWADIYVEKAIAAGVIEKAEKVDASAIVTREKAVKLIALAYGVAPVSGETKFADNSAIAAEYKPYIKAFQELGYIVGKGSNRFDPTGYYTRAEALQLLDSTTSEIADKSITGKTFEKSLIIRKPGVSIKDTKVLGDLIIGQGVGDGEAILENVEISGSLVAFGGGSNSIKVSGKTVPSTYANKPFGAPIRLSGNFGTVTVAYGTKVILSGKAEKLIILERAEVTLNTATVKEIEMTGANSILTTISGSITELLTISANDVTVSGNGFIRYAKVLASAKKGVRILTASTRITVDASAGAVTSLNGLVQPGTTAISASAANYAPSYYAPGQPSGSGSTDSKDDDEPPADGSPTPTPIDNLNDNIIDLGDITILESTGVIDVIYSENGTVTSINGPFTNKTATTEAEAAEILTSAKSLFGITGTILANDIEKQTDGLSDDESVYFRYSPTVSGLRVIGSQIVLSANPDGTVEGLTNAYRSDYSSVNVTATIASGAALAAAIEDLESSAIVTAFLQDTIANLGLDATSESALLASFETALTTSSSLVVYAYDKDKAPALAYEIIINVVPEFDNPLDFPYLPIISRAVYVYANGSNAGSIIRVLSQVEGATANAADALGRTRLITFTDDNRLYDETRNIATYKPATFGFNRVQSFYPGTIITKTGADWAPANVSLHANMAEAFDFYRNVLHLDSFDGIGSAVKSTMDIDSNGTLQGGEYDTSCWTPSLQQFLFGNKQARALDIVGHEYTHAVINNIVGDGRNQTLEYYGESGALNESLADIMGALIENKADISQIGEDSGAAVRNLQNPESFGQADHYDDIGSEQYEAILNGQFARDHEGVHVYSGIFNRAAYLMINDSRTASVTNEQWAKVFYKTMYRLASNSTFLEARGAVVCAADLLSFTTEQIDAIEDAFDEVGIKEKDSVRIILTWGETPRDLDSHLVGPSVTGSSRFHVYYSARNYYNTGTSTSPLYAADLDYDDVTSYGPEVTTIRVLTPGTYYYYVHDYSNRSSQSSSAMSNSSATIKVYLGAAETASATYNIRPGNAGIYWNVVRIEISQSGEVTLNPIDTFSGTASYS